MSWNQQQRLADFQQLSTRGTRIRKPKDWVANLIGSRQGLALLLSFLFVISSITVFGTRNMLHTNESVTSSCEGSECHGGMAYFPSFIPCFRTLLRKAFSSKPSLAVVPRYHDANKDNAPPWHGQTFR